jgi:hypothetical protein
MAAADGRTVEVEAARAAELEDAADDRLSEVVEGAAAVVGSAAGLPGATDARSVPTTSRPR